MFIIQNRARNKIKKSCVSNANKKHGTKYEFFKKYNQNILFRYDLYSLLSFLLAQLSFIN